MTNEIRENVEEILSRYETNEGRYMEHRYDEKGNEFHLSDDINTYFESIGVPYQYKVEEAFSSCGYDSSVGALCWYFKDDLDLITILFEYC